MYKTCGKNPEIAVAKTTLYFYNYQTLRHSAFCVVIRQRGVAVFGACAALRLGNCWGLAARMGISGCTCAPT